MLNAVQQLHYFLTYFNKLVYVFFTPSTNCYDTPMEKLKDFQCSKKSCLIYDGHAEHLVLSHTATRQEKCCEQHCDLYMVFIDLTRQEDDSTGLGMYKHWAQII